MTTLDRQLADDLLAVASRFPEQSALDRVALAPKRGQVQVQFVALGWSPEDPSTRA